MAFNTDAQLLPSLRTIDWDKLPKIGIGWEIGLTHGWGIHGYHLARRILERGLACPYAVGGLKDPVKANVIKPYPLDCGELLRWDRKPDFQVIQAGSNSPKQLSVKQGDSLIQVFENIDNWTPEDVHVLSALGHRVITVSNWNSEFLLTKGIDAPCVHLGVDTEMFQPRPRQERFGSDRFVVFSGGKCELRKGQDIVLAAFRIFQLRHPEAALVTMWHNHWPSTMASMVQSPYVGGLPSIGFCEWVEHNGVPLDVYEDIGLVGRQELAGLMPSFDVALFPNRCEGGTNMVAMECLAAGVPTILSRGHGHDDLIGHPVPCFALDIANPCTLHEANERWVEPDIDEVVESLEYVYQHRSQGISTGINAAFTMQGYWNWDTRIDAQLDALRVGKDDSGLDAAMAATKVTLEKSASHTLQQETANEFSRFASQLRNAGHRKAAVAVAKRAVRIAPDNAEVVGNLGNILLTDNQPHASLEASKRALQLKPSLTITAANMGLAHLYSGNPEAAVREFDKVADTMIGSAFDRSHALLSMGHWRTGLKALEVRRLHKPESFPKYSMPEWEGEKVRTLWVTSEQGIGDAFMFARFLPWARERCDRLIFSTHAQTIPMFAGYPGTNEVQLLDGLMPEPAADAHVPLMSLAHLYGATPSNMPADPGHFINILKPLTANLSAPAGVRKVGIVWSGNSVHSRDWERSLPLEAFLPLLESPCIQLYSLQVGPRAKDLEAIGIEKLVPDLSSKLIAWGVTAAVLKSLDALVTCDTAVAHLAGALGIKTYLLLCKLSDWRWLLKREDTPWYPSVRLVRQKRLGEWNAPMALVVQKLDKFMPEKPLGGTEHAANPSRPVPGSTGVGAGR